LKIKWWDEDSIESGLTLLVAEAIAHCGREAMAELNLPPLAPESLLLLVLE
jgi:hypothetical protein